MCLGVWSWESANEGMSSGLHRWSPTSLAEQPIYRISADVETGLCEVPLPKGTPWKSSYGAKFRVLIPTHKTLCQAPCPLVDAIPSCLFPPELDHYLLSFHMFAHALPSAWVLSFHVSAWQMPYSAPALSPRHREGLFQATVVPSI